VTEGANNKISSAYKIMYRLQLGLEKAARSYSTIIFCYCSLSVGVSVRGVTGLHFMNPGVKILMEYITGTLS